MRSDLNGLNDENEIKIFILYLMNQVNYGVRYDEIENMTYESGYVGYFDFAEIFAKLAEDKNIEEHSENGESIYHITQRGKAIAENLEHLITPATKIKGTAVAARHSDLKKSGAVTSCVLEEENSGYRFKCSISGKEDKEEKEENREIFHVSLFIKDKATAEKILETFRQNPNAVYRGVYAMLTGNADFLF